MTNASSVQSDNADSGDTDTETYSDIAELNDPQLSNPDREGEAIVCVLENQQCAIASGAALRVIAEEKV